MQRFIAKTRYLIALPIIGLALAASFLFIFGGFGLIRSLIEFLVILFTDGSESLESTVVIIDVVEYVHSFLVGTVLYITAVGFYQLFIKEINFPEWLKIDNTEELETNLIGVTVVVLAVNFMSAVFIGGQENLLDYGAGIALPIAALGIFIGLRAWSAKMNKEISTRKHGQNSEGTSTQIEGE